MSVGPRIVELRKAKGWTQAQLAKVAQLSASAIAMYETNRRVPDQSALAKLAVAFQVSVIDLSDPLMVDVNEAVAATAPATHSVSLTTFTLNREESRLILFLRMNPQCRPFLESYVMSDENKRQQLERTWRLIHDFQK
jgi:transcriptional regulator with XRE-family HTH domain